MENNGGAGLPGMGGMGGTTGGIQIPGMENNGGSPLAATGP